MVEHELLILLVDILVLLIAARTGGALAIRIGVPEVVGEILFGICVGPTLLGRIWPAGFEWLFPSDPTHRAVLDAISWIGVLFLVTVAGLETRLGILRRSARNVAFVWTGGFLLPFACGFAFGLLVPDDLIGPGVERPVFAFFLAIAMAISAIPVIARILLDLGVYGTRVGMVTLSSAVADDTLGWVLLGGVSAVVASGSVASGTVWWAAGGTVLFVILAFTIAPAAVAFVVRASLRTNLPFAQVTTALGLVVAGAVITQAIGVHMVLGAFVVAVLLGRTRELKGEVMAPIRQIGFGFFIPVFFAYTGVKADLGLLHGPALVATLVALVVAFVSKFVGGGLGARLSGLPRWEAAAIGTGLTARGAMELVIATIGLSIGILSGAAYAMLVVVAIVTSMIAGPLLRVCLTRAGVMGSQTAATSSESPVTVTWEEREPA